MRVYALSIKCALVTASILALLFPPLSLQAADASPDEVVRQFNTAISAGDVDTAISTLAEGSIQFQLRAAHPGMSANPPLTADLRKNWQVVGAILFPSVDAYERIPVITASTMDGDIATVWATTTTITQRKGVAEPMRLEFSELYLLVKKEGQWKIAANIDNRQPDSIDVSGSDAPATGP